MAEMVTETTMAAVAAAVATVKDEEAWVFSMPTPPPLLNMTYEGNGWMECKSKWMKR